ncbi:hypothetical protein QOU19_10010 [Pseudomonas aeruginosa]
MSSTQHQLIEQCATRLRGIVEALDNIHDNTPHRWSTDLDDVHSSAESLLALIKDQAPAPCIDCKGTGFCNSISGEEIRCPCRAPIQFADPAQSPVEQLEQAPPSEDQLIAAGLSYPLAKEDAVKLWYAGFRSEVVTVLEAWEAIGHDIGMNPSKGELLESLRNMAAICNAHGNDMPAQSAIDQRQVIADAITGALAFGAQASQPPTADHWLRPFYDIGRAEGQRTQDLAMLVRMLASSLKRHAPESNLVARATNYLAAKGLSGTPLRDAPASVEQAGRDVEPAPCPFCGGEVDPTGWLRGDGTRGPECNDCGATARSMEAWQTRAAPTGQTPQAWLDVQAERKRQITAEGWTPEHDDAHSHGQMARAAACYALAGSSAPNDGTAALLVSLAWPWDEQWWKPTTTRRDLVKACALGLAEIERLDRAGISQSPQPGATTASS